MLKKWFAGGLIIGLMHLSLAFGPDLYEGFALGQIPDELCDIVEAGKGTYPVAGCECDCSLDWGYLLLICSGIIGAWGVAAVSAGFFVAAIDFVRHHWGK